MKKLEKFNAISLNKNGMSDLVGGSGYDYTWVEIRTGNMGKDGKEVIILSSEPD